GVGGIGNGGRTHSAGTSEIARQSGGDSAMVDDSGAVEDTLQRIRQRYALYFYLPQDAKAGSERNIEVSLSASARQRHTGAEVRYRQRYLAPGAGGGADVVDAESVSVFQAPEGRSSDSTQPQPGLRRRRPAVDDASGSRGPMTGGWPVAGSGSTSSASESSPAQDSQQGGWRKTSDADSPAVPAPPPVVESAPARPAPATPAPAAEPEQKGGWRKVQPGEQP
ncbi:MAG: hypothetical protein SGI92_09835, partial [Bryobacteraceae bacterium]|nr:hypothetical protein [Bryobacteraceae bacterium]